MFSVLDPASRQRLSSTIDDIAAIRMALDILTYRSGRTDPKVPDPAPQFLTITTQGQTSQQTSIAMNVLSIKVGGDTAGRGTFQIGSDKSTHALWVLANMTSYFPFGWEERIIIPQGVVFTWNPPSGTTNWDLTVAYLPSDPSERGV